MDISTLWAVTDHAGNSVVRMTCPATTTLHDREAWRVTSFFVRKKMAGKSTSPVSMLLKEKKRIFGCDQRGDQESISNIVYTYIFTFIWTLMVSQSQCTFCSLQTTPYWSEYRTGSSSIWIAQIFEIILEIYSEVVQKTPRGYLAAIGSYPGLAQKMVTAQNVVNDCICCGIIQPESERIHQSSWHSSDEQEVNLAEVVSNQCTGWPNMLRVK